MGAFSVGQRAGAEFVGNALLLATVIGSGVMAAKLSGGNDGLALLGNTIATGAMLVVLITVFGPVSGAHLNPAVSGVFWLRGEISGGSAVMYVLAQVTGGIAGVIAAHAMFELPLIQLATKVRTGSGQWFAEAVATFGLLLTILGTRQARPTAVAMNVGLYIIAAYWFTASTSFANPAVTIARAISETFAGIRPLDVAPFIAAQLAGALAGMLVAGLLFRPSLRASSKAVPAEHS